MIFRKLKNLHSVFIDIHLVFCYTKSKIYSRKGLYMKKDYLKTIKTYTKHLSDDQLIDLLDIHSELFNNSSKVKVPISYLDKPFNDFVYYIVKHSTPKSQYINVINIIHLIISDYYTTEQIHTILLDLI